MKQTLVKPTIKVGSGAGVLLPKEWINSIVEVTPIIINPRLLDVIKLINVEDVKGIYLTGSYARGDMDINSDIDILIITNTVNKTKKIGRYELNYIAENNINDENLIIILPMLLEAKSLLNSVFLKELQEKSKKSLTNELIYKYSLNCLNILDLNKEEIELAKLKKQKYVKDHIGYSLILRLRTNYILNCIKLNKKWNKKELLKLIKKITGSLNAYQSYLNIKLNKPKNNYLSIEEAEKILTYLYKETKKYENHRFSIVRFRR